MSDRFKNSRSAHNGTSEFADHVREEEREAREKIAQAYADDWQTKVWLINSSPEEVKRHGKRR